MFARDVDVAHNRPQICVAQDGRECHNVACGCLRESGREGVPEIVNHERLTGGRQDALVRVLNF
jgi:hypothetical protein